MQRQQQRHRIRAAGYRRRDAAWPTQILPGLCDGFQQKKPFVHTRLFYPVNAGNARGFSMFYDSFTSLPVMCSGTRRNMSVRGPEWVISFSMYALSRVNLWLSFREIS